MKTLKLDSVLLFALVIPFIMTYRLGPGDTPYWLFGLIFLGLVGNVLCDYLPLKERSYERLKHFLLWTIIIIVIGSAFFSAIVVRHMTHPVYMIHDIILQQEAAIRFFLDGKNPYATTYFGTFLEQWHYGDGKVNPALYHFVMEPLYLLFVLPFYFVSNRLIGYFDARIPLLFLFLVLLFFADRLVKSPEKKRSFLSLLAFHPALLPYTLEGRSDIFMFAFVFVGLFFLQKKKQILSAILLGCSFAIKQSIWPLAPFYFAYIYFTSNDKKQVIITFVTFAVTFALFTVPFLLWNTKAFLDSTIFYLSGNTVHSYPISGYGFGKILESFGFIKDVNVYYPFSLWQGIFGLPLLGILLFYLKKSPSIVRMLFCYTIFLFVYWYFSRYFHNSHIAYISYVLIVVYFWPNNEISK